MASPPDAHSVPFTDQIRRALGGDRDAEDAVLGELLPTLRQRARQVKRHEPRDVVTDALVATAVRRALRRRRKPLVNDSQHFVNLLTKQMRHAVVEYGRRRRSSHETSLDGKSPLCPAPDLFVVTDRMRAVLERFRALDPERFNILWRREAEEEAWESIADDLGITVAQAKYRYKTAFAWLAAELRPRKEAP